MFIGNGFGIGVTKLSKQNMGQWHAYTKRDGRGIGVHIYKLLYSITRYDRVYMVFWLYLLVQSTVQWLEKVNQWCRDHGSREIRHSPKSVNGTKWEREREREIWNLWCREGVGHSHRNSRQIQLLLPTLPNIHHVVGPIQCKNSQLTLPSLLFLTRLHHPITFADLL